MTDLDSSFSTQRAPCTRRPFRAFDRLGERRFLFKNGASDADDEPAHKRLGWETRMEVDAATLDELILPNTEYVRFAPFERSSSGSPRFDSPCGVGCRAFQSRTSRPTALIAGWYGL